MNAASPHRGPTSNGSATPNDSATPDVSRPLAPLAGALDRSCQEILSAYEAGRRPTELHVSPAVYESVAAIRPAEVAAGRPLMVLGLRLVRDPALTSEATSIQ
ncbi:MAG: hypothetical protein ACRDT8_23240 [Micromonosporaceae bacterium]